MGSIHDMLAKGSVFLKEASLMGMSSSYVEVSKRLARYRVTVRE